MEQFLNFLKEKGTCFEKISDNEIIVPVIALVATVDQYENDVPSSEYMDNPLFCDEAKIYLTFEGGNINWMIVLPPPDEE